MNKAKPALCPSLSASLLRGQLPTEDIFIKCSRDHIAEVFSASCQQQQTIAKAALHCRS